MKKYGFESFLGMLGSLERLLGESEKDISYFQKSITFGGYTVSMREEIRGLYQQILDSSGFLEEGVMPPGIPSRLEDYSRRIDLLSERAAVSDRSRGHIEVN